LQPDPDDPERQLMLSNGFCGGADQLLKNLKDALAKREVGDG
jgi:hypothetical protein